MLRAVTGLRRGSAVDRGGDPASAVASRRRPTDVLFVVVVAVLIAVHLTIFIATMVLAPVTPQEAQGLALVQLPVEVARALVLPFHALLLGCLFVLGRRAAGRWAGFGSMLALLALDLRADAANPVYGPATAEGGWIAAALFALALVLLSRRPLVAAALVGAASAFYAGLLLALPAFLVALAIHGVRGRRAVSLASFAGVWAVPTVLMQVLWVARLGPQGWIDRASALTGLTGLFRPHGLVPFLEQQRIVFAAWHYPAIFTFVIAQFLFITAILGVIRYFVVPRPHEDGGALRILQRFPVELWAGFLTMLLFGLTWAVSGQTTVIVPDIPVLAAIAPLLTALAYRGAKWLLTVNRFWALASTVYLVGLILARSTQLVITLVHAFQY